MARRNAAPSPFAAHLPAQTFRFTERTCRARAIPSSFRGTPRRAPIGVLKNVTLQRRRTEEGYLRAIHPVRGNKVRVMGDYVWVSDLAAGIPEGLAALRRRPLMNSGSYEGEVIVLADSLPLSTMIPLRL